MMLTGTLMLSQMPHQTTGQSQQQQQPQQLPSFNQASSTSSSGSSNSSSVTNSTISSTVPHIMASNQQLSNSNHHYHDSNNHLASNNGTLNSISHTVSTVTAQGANGITKKYYAGQTAVVNGGSVHEEVLIENESEFRNGAIRPSSQSAHVYPRTNNNYSHGPTSHNHPSHHQQQQMNQQNAHSYDHEVGMTTTVNSQASSNMMNSSKYRSMSASGTAYSPNSQMSSSNNPSGKSYMLSSSNANHLINELKKQNGQDMLVLASDPSSSTSMASAAKASSYFDGPGDQKALANGSIYERVNKRRDGGQEVHANNHNNMRDGSRSLSKMVDQDRENGEHFDDMKKIEVQILPQDDNWGENTTAMTADLSDINDDMTEDGRSIRFQLNPPSNNKLDQDESGRSFFACLGHALAKRLSFILTALIIISSFLTPILFVILPYMQITSEWQLNECGLECEGLLIGIAFRLLFLLFSYLIMYKIQKGRDNELPRVYELKALLIFVLFIMTFSYWLFYSVRIINTNLADYYKILQFTASYVEVLWYLLVISVFALKLRHLRSSYVVRVMRSPDGEFRQFDIGTMSIQRAALFILEQYYSEFHAYNPWLENAQRKRNTQLVQIDQMSCKRRGRGAGSSGASMMKRASEGEASEGDMGVDNCETESNYNNKRGSLSRRSTNGKSADVQSITNILGANLSATDRLYKEYEYERRLKRRKARLITTTEEAFNSIRRVATEMLETSENSGNNAPTTGMDPFEAAQALFAAIARDLRRYLRLTRQQPYFTRDQIVSHLANCIAYDMSPKSFLQKFIEGEMLLFNERALVNQYNQNKYFEYQQELYLKRQEQQRLGQPIYTGNNYTSSIPTLDQTWILISDNPLYQNIENNLMIVLKQNDVTLMCTFKRLPRFKLIEDILDPKRNKFVLKLNSETTV